MIGRIFRWNRTVLPPWWAIAVFLILYLGLDLLHLVFVGWFLVPAGNLRELIVMRWSLVGVAAVAFAIFRVSFHPALRSEYRDWLIGMPWTRDKPLPLGPVHLIPQDGIILVFLLLMMRTGGMELVRVAFAYFFAYELAMAATLIVTGERWAAYGLLFCLAIALRFAQAGGLGTVIVAFLYALTYWAHWRCLARFPWRDAESFRTRAVQLLRLKGQQIPVASEQLGFPFEYLSPKVNAPSIGLAEGTALSLLAGAWLYAAAAKARDAESRDAISALCCIYSVLTAIVVRLRLYCGRYLPPISLLGRFTSPRTIILPYDKVFVAPLATLLVFAGGCFLFLNTAVGQIWGMPLTLALALSCSVNLGPKLLDWRLTGAHRLGLGIRNRQQYVEP